MNNPIFKNIISSPAATFCSPAAERFKKRVYVTQALYSAGHSRTCFKFAYGGSAGAAAIPSGVEWIT